MYLTSFIKSIFFFMVALLFLVGSPLSAAKPVKTDVAKEKKVPPGKVKTPIVEETSDTTAPVITLNGSNPMDVTQGDTFIDPGATDTDDTDGSVTVSAIGSVDISTVGTYTITYTASDSAGNNATEIRTVNVTAAPIVEETPICIAGDAALEGILKDSTTGVALANVEVSVGGCSTTTNEQGFYTLQNIAVNERAVVTFKSNGYYQKSVIIQIEQYLEGTSELSSNYLEVDMDTFDSQLTYSSQDSKIIYAGNGATISLPASAYMDISGNTFNGNITAKAAYLNVTTETGRQAFPGLYEGVNSEGATVPFVSYGAFAVELGDDNSNSLDFSANVTVTFPSLGLSEHNIIPLWYYDYEQGLWFEEGYAELQPDGTYHGEISHSGTWSLNLPVENALGIYRARIVYEDGTPAKGVRVHTAGTNWIRTDLSTDSEGIFEIEVIPDSSFQLKAYNYREKCEAVYDGTIQAIASGEIIEDRM